MATFSAAYAGRCGNCGEPFAPGAEVYYDADDSLNGQECCGLDDDRNAVRGAEALTAPADKVMPRGRTAGDRCDRCFQIPASNGSCGCS